MEDATRTKADFLNQVTRSLMAILFTFTACLAFMWGVIKGDIRIDAAAFLAVAAIAIGWWFGQMNDRKRASDSNGGTNGAKTPIPPAAP